MTELSPIKPCAPYADILREFLRELRTLAAAARHEAERAEALEVRDLDQALVHMAASVEAGDELVALITGPRGQLCLTELDRALRSGVVA